MRRLAQLTLSALVRSAEGSGLGVAMRFEPRVSLCRVRRAVVSGLLAFVVLAAPVVVAAAQDIQQDADIDLLVWAYGLLPSSAERTQLKNMLALDSQEFVNLRRDLDALHAFRQKLTSADTLEYMSQWVALHSRLMRATPPGRTTGLAHDMQTRDTGERRFCASSSTDLVKVGFLGQTFVCGGYRFLLSSVAPRARITDAHISFAPIGNGVARREVKWQTLTDAWQVVADSPSAAPVAMRLVGTELYISVAPPRLAPRAASSRAPITSSDEGLVGAWVWTNRMSIGSAAHASIVRTFAADGGYEEQLSLFPGIRTGHYTISGGRLTILYSKPTPGAVSCDYTLEGNTLELSRCSDRDGVQRHTRDPYVK